MRVLILGGDGMLGHALLATLAPRHEVRATLRQGLEAYRHHGLFSEANAFPGVDVRRFDSVVEVMSEFRPQVVINAVGIVKQRALAKEALPSIEINALLPHRLSLLCRAASARLVHFSTDCVFSGRKGRYRETDPSDGEDLYGRTKYLGEVHEAGCLTLRSSIIGLELSRKTSLVEWFLAQPGPVRGYRRAIYTGLTTTEMSRLVERVLTEHPDLSGVWHVASAPISKYDLLRTFAERLGAPRQIEADEEFACDRSLDGSAFARAAGYAVPSWDAMLEELAKQVRTRKDER